MDTLTYTMGPLAKYVPFADSAQIYRANESYLPYPTTPRHFRDGPRWNNEPVSYPLWGYPAFHRELRSHLMEVVMARSILNSRLKCATRELREAKEAVEALRKRQMYFDMEHLSLAIEDGSLVGCVQSKQAALQEIVEEAEWTHCPLEDIEVTKD